MRSIDVHARPGLGYLTQDCHVTSEVFVYVVLLGSTTVHSVTDTKMRLLLPRPLEFLSL
jgi:hypothetical protein